jgi:uncharacterized Tic20 family protein
MDENVENAETPQEPQDVGSAGQPQEVSQNARNMAMLCHLLGFFTSFVGPLIIWLLKKEEDSFIDQQGKEALNFQIAVIIASFVAGLLSFLCIGFLLFPVIGILDLVFVIMACVKSSKGEDYRYPLSIRLVK